MKTKKEHVAPEAETPTPSNFADLGLPEAALDVLAQLGFASPTPIQVAAIPPLLAGRDVLGRARTGTGKTAAFGLPLLARLSERVSGRPRGLVLAPTRELALQVTEALKSMAHRPLRIVTVYGGSPYGPQLRALRDGVEVVVGTPGRIIDLLERTALDLSELELLVLDEADEMLKMGFIEDVERVLAATPEERQVALFSATMPDQIRRVAKQWLRDPIEAADKSGSSVEAIEQLYVQVPGRNKREALQRILLGEPRTAAIIFAATKAECDEVTHVLQRSGFAAEALHGDLSQPARERVVQQLRDRRLDLVVATDIAARGIDIDHLDLIVNLDLPKNVEVYTHRIGRTGRAGRKGRAITFVVPRESYPFVQALSRMGMKVQELFLPSEKTLVERRRELMAAEALSWLEAGGDQVEVARGWAQALLAEHEAEALVTALLGRLAEETGVSLASRLDAGVPPWARQPGVMKAKAVPAAKARAAQEARYEAPAARERYEAPAQPVQDEARLPRQQEEAPALEQREAPREDKRPEQRDAPALEQREAPREDKRPEPREARVEPRQPRPERDERRPDYDDGRPRRAVRPREMRDDQPSSPGDSWVLVGVGRNDGVRPSDLVGALANELGIPGASIGRIELRDASALVQVADDFADRLGDGSWPLQVRRIDTEVRRHQGPPRAARLPQERPTRGPRGSRQDSYEPRQGGPGPGPRYGGPGPRYGGHDGPRYGGQDSRYGGQDSRYGGQDSRYGGHDGPRYGGPHPRYGTPRDGGPGDHPPERRAPRAPKPVSGGDKPPRRPRS